METLIIFGAKYAYLIIVVVALWYVYQQPKERRYRMLLCTLLALPISYVVAKIGSIFYFDPRPFVVESFTPLLPHVADNGFPSDHTLLSAAIASVVYFFNRKLGIFLFILALLVGVSRVAAGIHHVVDILGSLGIAFAVTFLVFRFVFSDIWKYWSIKNLIR